MEEASLLHRQVREDSGASIYELSLTPSMHSPERKITRGSAVFSLTATMVGGGVLSLSYAFSLSGIAVGFVMLSASAVVSGFSISLLLSCSRRSGAVSYEEVAYKAYGHRAKALTMALVVALTFLATVGYMILVRDLSGELVQAYILKSGELSDWNERLVLVVTMLPVMPLCYMPNLNALRFTSFASLMALTLLACVIIVRCVQRTKVRKIEFNALAWTPPALGDALYAFPFMQVAFMCHFNVLPIHADLIKPTRRRLGHVMRLTMGIAFIFYAVIALSGYLYAFDHHCVPPPHGKSPKKCTDGVPDNILNSFDEGDGLMDLGRLGLLCSLLFSMPLLVLPCRATINQVIVILMRGDKPKTGVGNESSIHRGARGDAGYTAIEEDFEDAPERVPERPTMGKGSAKNSGALSGKILGGVADEDFGVSPEANGVHDSIVSTPNSAQLPILGGFESPDEFRAAQLKKQDRLSERESQTDKRLLSELRSGRLSPLLLPDMHMRPSGGYSFRGTGKHLCWHFTLTTAILAVALLLAVSVPGVGIIWNLLGSSVSISLAFILPCAFYLKIRSFGVENTFDSRDRRLGVKGHLARVLLVVSIITAVVCTVESVISIVT